MLAWNAGGLRYLSPMDRKPAHLSPYIVALLLFFLSGTFALVYQVVWARMMTHVFGSTALAVGTVLAGFMAGLALGSRVGGRLADRSDNCLRLYAWLEIGIGVAAGLAHLLLQRMDGVYPSLHGLLEGSPLPLALVRFGLVFALVLAPTLLMGATLPVLTRFLVSFPSNIGERLGSLYAANTAGAVAGVILTGFFLIGQFGIHPPVYAAVLGNLLTGLIAALASVYIRQPSTSPSGADVPEDTARPDESQSAGTIRLVVFGLGLSGFTSFAYEIYWTRSLVFLMGNSTYALTTMLSAFLTGIAAGGYLVRFLVARVGDRAALFGWLQVSLGLFSVVALPLLFLVADPPAVGKLLSETATRPLAQILSGFAVAFGVMLVPAMLIGATFPLAGQMAARRRDNAGDAVGRVYAVNTLGNVLGALLPGAFLLSWLGIQRGIVAMAMLNMGVGLVILVVRIRRAGLTWRWRLALSALLAVALLVISQAPLDFRFPSEGEAPHHETLFYREGPLATTKVFRDPNSSEKLMSVDGIVIGGTGNTEFKQLLLAHLPKLLLDDVSRELSVGLGSGILAGESALHDRVRQITAVEIEPSVIAGAAWFADENHAVLEHDKLRIVGDDIGNYLRTTATRFQVISADEKTADEYASNGFSYSREYYQLLLDHLLPGGLVAQWVPATLPPRQYRMILNTFSGVFPNVQLWYFLPAWKRGPFNSILIGSHDPIAIDRKAIDARFRGQPEAFASLRRYGITSADTLLPHFMATDRQIRRAVADAPINTFAHPRYEFYRPWDYARDRAEKVLANHEMLLRLKRKAMPSILAQQTGTPGDLERLRQTMRAEDRYLVGFARFLQGLPMMDTYRLFDAILATASWNDSLRARIYAQYVHLASTRADPAERAMLMRRARQLYTDPGG